MNVTFLLPITSGILLAVGQFCMKRFAMSLPATLTPFWPAAYAVILSPFLYLFLILNLTASVTYIGTLRYMTMTTTFALVFVTMGTAVLCLDIFVNRIVLSPLNVFGVVLGVVAIILIATR